MVAEFVACIFEGVHEADNVAEMGRLRGCSDHAGPDETLHYGGLFARSAGHAAQVCEHGAELRSGLDGAAWRFGGV